MPLAKPRLTVERATEAHAVQLAQYIRKEDADEMRASVGMEPLEGLRMSIRVSSMAKAIMDGRRVVALFGIAPAGDYEGAASVWLLGGRLVKRLPVAFMRVCSAEIRRLSEAWAVLFNMVWAENKQSLRWLRALGFEVFEPIPFGVRGLPFHPVFLRRS